MNLNFIAYIGKINLWWSFHYIFNHAKHQTKNDMHGRQTLKHKPNLSIKPFPLNPLNLRIKPFPLNPLNFSPIVNNCRNGWTNLEGQYSTSSSLRCALLIKWVESNAPIQWRILGGTQTILRIQRLQHDDKVKKYQRMIQEMSKIRQTIWIKDVMIRSTKCSKKTRGNSPRYVHYVGFVF